MQIVTADRWDPIDEFYSFFMDVLGAYLDLESALMQLRMISEKTRSESKTKLNMTDQELDKTWCIYGEGDPNISTKPPLYLSSQGAFRQRISPGGIDSKICGYMCIVIIYQVWEEHARKEIADGMGVEKNDLQFDLMGDIRNLRRSIVHRGGKAEKAIEWLNIDKNDVIKMNLERWKILKEKLILVCRELKKRMYGFSEDPKWRYQ